MSNIFKIDVVSLMTIYLLLQHNKSDKSSSFAIALRA